MAHSNHAKFARELRKLAGEKAGWPFLCNGSPFDCGIFLVGINPVVNVPLWQHWSEDTGVNKEAWLQTYLSKRKSGKLTPTRERIQRLVNAAAPARILETNIYHHCSPREKDLPSDQRGTEVFEFLITELRPKIVFVHGRSAIRHLERETSTELEYGQLIPVSYQNVAFEAFAHRHLSYQCSYDEVEKLGRKLRKRLDTILGRVAD